MVVSHSFGCHPERSARLPHQSCPGLSALVHLHLGLCQHLLTCRRFSFLLVACIQSPSGHWRQRKAAEEAHQKLPIFCFATRFLKSAGDCLHYFAEAPQSDTIMRIFLLRYDYYHFIIIIIIFFSYSSSFHLLIIFFFFFVFFSSHIILFPRWYYYYTSAPIISSVVFYNGIIIMMKLLSLLHFLLSVIEGKGC